MADFRDHFSGHASAYAAHRPTYPDSLIEWLIRDLPQTAQIWDCGTGSGQAACSLADKGNRVLATDASAAQIERAQEHSGVTYRVAPAERSGLPDRSVDLVTVAQALHWFDHDRFNREVRRVLRPGGRVVAWGYQLFEISPLVDAIIAELYHDIVGPDWPAERALLDEGYQRVPWPYETLPTPSFTMEASWDLDAVVGYLSTWSACRRHRSRTGEDPMARIQGRLRSAWEDPDRRRTVRWPLIVKAGVVPGRDRG